MLNYSIDLNAREKHPLSRCLCFTKGDRNASTLSIRFFSGDEQLGLESGSYATLGVMHQGETQAAIYPLTKEDGGVYSIVLGDGLTAGTGITRCNATLYARGDRRLTIGRFTYVLEDDPTLPKDAALTREQVSLLQQLFASVALQYDEAENIKAGLIDTASYAKEMGDYAMEWAKAAENALEGNSATWESLPGKPASFPPSAHTHEEFENLLGDLHGPMVFDELPQNIDSILGEVDTFSQAGIRAGYFAITTAPDAPEPNGMCMYFAPSQHRATILYAGTSGFYFRYKIAGLWGGDWVSMKPTSSLSYGEKNLTLRSANWASGSIGNSQQISISPFSVSYPASISFPVGLNATQRAAVYKAKLYVYSVSGTTLTIACDGEVPSCNIPVLLQYLIK